MDVIRAWKEELVNDKFFQSLDHNVRDLILLHAAKVSVTQLKTIRLLSKKHLRLVDTTLHYRYFNLKLLRLFTNEDREFRYRETAAEKMRVLALKNRAFTENLTLFGSMNIYSIWELLAQEHDDEARPIFTILADQQQNIPLGFIRTFFAEYCKDEPRAKLYLKNPNDFLDDDSFVRHFKETHDKVCKNAHRLFTYGWSDKPLRFMLGLGVNVSRQMIDVYGAVVRETLMKYPITEREWKHIIYMGNDSTIRVILTTYYNCNRQYHDTLLSCIDDPPVAEPPVAEPPVAEPPVAEPPVAEPTLTRSKKRRKMK